MLLFLSVDIFSKLIFKKNQDQSKFFPRKVRILILSAKVGILTSRRTVPELSRFSLCAEHIQYYSKAFSEKSNFLPFKFLNDLEKLIEFFFARKSGMSPIGEVNILTPIGDLPGTACILFVTK